MRRLLAAGALVALAGCGQSHAQKASEPSFGGFPSFLPKDTVTGTALHKVVDASAGSPALATQGDAVRVHVASGATVLAQVAGPEVPNQGLAVQPETTPATWTFTFSQATGTVPLALGAFNAIDDQGRVYKLSVETGSTVPASIAPGQTVTFRLTTHMATGEGRMRWIPEGHLAPVEWDFVVEID